MERQTERKSEKERERKKGKETLETFFVFYLCVLLGKEQPYIFEPKKLKI